MIQIELSRILQEFLNFKEECGQVFIKVKDEFKWFDMLYTTVEQKLHLFLYILHKYAYSRKILIGYEPVHIIDDSMSLQEAEVPSIFTIDTFHDIEPLLQNYNITTSRYPDSSPRRHFAIITLEAFESYAASGEGLKNYCKYICEQLSLPGTDLEALMPSEVFIDCKVGTSIAAYITPIQTLTSQGYIFTYINAGYGSYQEEVTLQAPTSPKYDSTTIDGWTQIDGKYLWWIITHSARKELPYETLWSFYGYLVGVSTPNIYISSKGLAIGENTAVNKTLTFQTTTEYSIPRGVLYLLALVHINTGKVIEFVGFAQHFEHTYLEAVAEYSARNMCELRDRIDAFTEVKLNSLYLTFIHKRVLPFQVKQKLLSLKFKVVRLADILNRINFTTKEVSITSGITDMLPFDEWTHEDFNPANLELLSIFDVIKSVLGNSSGSFKDDAYKTESFVYAILRLLEQKLFKFNKVKSMADLIAFRSDSEIYIGFGAIKPEYHGKLFLCAGEISSMPYMVTEIIPSSVLIEEEPSNSMLDELLQKCKLSASARFTEEEAKMLVMALAATKAVGTPYTFEDNIEKLHMDHPVDALLKTSLCRDYNYVVRKELWSELTQHFSSFGLRMLNIQTAPLTIYGGINVILSDKTQVQVYPIAFDKFPRRAINDI